MKYKLYSFLNEKNKALEKKPEALTHFEIPEVTDIPIADLLKQNYDAIEFDGSQYEKFAPFITAVDWKTSHMATADCLILKSNVYKPYNILAATIVRILKKNIDRVNSQLPVIVIGDIYFVTSIVTKLALSGFVEIVISLTEADADGKSLQEFENKIKSFVFDLNLKSIPINDLTSIDQAGFLLISNFKKEKNKDAYELLAYFNFLSEGAIFIDCNSINDSYLVDDARKADMFVIDEAEVLENKYNYLLELLKNSP